MQCNTQPSLGCRVLSSHQYWGGLLEVLQQIPLHQGESFALGHSAKDALHTRRWTPLGPESYPVIVGLQPLTTVRTHHLQQMGAFLLRWPWEEGRGKLYKSWRQIFWCSQAYLFTTKEHQGTHSIGAASKGENEFLKLFSISLSLAYQAKSQGISLHGS